MTPISRLSHPSEGGYYKEENASDSNEAWAGFLHLSDAQIRSLAEAIVVELKDRVDAVNGERPYLSLAEFVNRSLRTDKYHRSGLLQAAIDRSGLNSAFGGGMAVDMGAVSGKKFQNEGAFLDAANNARSAAAMAPGYLLQGDLLTLIGSAISVRSDTFRVRAYGNCLDPETGRVLAQAWCEVIVQRYAEPLVPPEGKVPTERTYWEPEDNNGANQMGRRFRVVDFRWLRPDEV